MFFTYAQGIIIGNLFFLIYRYHCPTDFLVKKRNYVKGVLYPVKESYIAKHKGVYEQNERVGLFGTW